ncbi:hypothetical protein [Agrococcus sp. ARC_14]|uniref:hypothetical protein n=1 Tax=Agrococcus sp. ARC_14 TaxID=2919927 RepID=UPI001F062454|nr:hypothetical protein [Agrococcus sp. ARC_14]MCH1884288.1 hypothetical protein [Agrococcus sp. ARC_14]
MSTPISARLERRTGEDRTATVEALRERLRGMQQAEPQHASPTLDEAATAGLDEVVQWLRAGRAHSIESRSLALACMGAAMPAGAWGAIVGMPDLGIEAARDLGVPIDRVALVPHPGRSWLDVVASLAEAMPVVLAASPGRVAPTDAARLAARLRQASSTLLIAGPWPNAATVVRSVRADWQGLDDGDGRIAAGSIVVETVAGGAPSFARIPIAGDAAAAAAVAAAARESGDELLHQPAA